MGINFVFSRLLHQLQINEVSAIFSFFRHSYATATPGLVSISDAKVLDVFLHTCDDGATKTRPIFCVVGDDVPRAWLKKLSGRTGHTPK